MSNCPVNPVPHLGLIAQAACKNGIFTGRGAAAGMGVCPENDLAAVIARPVVWAEAIPRIEGDCFGAKTAPRNDISKPVIHGCPPRPKRANSSRSRKGWPSGWVLGSAAGAAVGMAAGWLVGVG